MRQRKTPAPARVVGGELAKRQTAVGYTTKLSPEVTAVVVQAIRAGGTLDTAAAHAGIDKATYHRWLKDGRNLQQIGIAEDDPRRDDLLLLLRFVEEIDQALADFKLVGTGGILKAGAEQWQAYAWLLERKFPDEFGRRTRVDHANADGTPFQLAQAQMIDPSKLSDDELDRLIELLEKGKPSAVGAPELPRQVVREILAP